MESNNIDPCFARLPLGDHKYYQKPAIWVGKLQPFRMICGSGMEDPWGGANEDHSNWEEGKGNSSVWEEEEE